MSSSQHPHKRFPDQSTRFAYVMHHFRLAYDLPGVTVSQDASAQAEVYIPVSSEASIFETNKHVDVERVQWRSWKGKSIPFFFGTQPEGSFFTQKDGKLSFQVDLISHIFFFLSGWQEVVTSERDSLGRFPYQASLQHRLRFAKLPVVNYYFDILKTGIEALTGSVINPRKLNPDGPVFYLSHDIDSCQSAWLQGTKHELKTGRPLSALNLLMKKASGKDDWFNFDRILDIEGRRNAKSSFYFLARNNRVNGLANADYDITSKPLQKVLDNIMQNGSEVGIHGSLGTSTNLDLLQDDIRRIGRKMSGGRFHFLSYDPVRTVSVMEKVGIQYDSSLGFAETIGFRNGYCGPFYLFDHENQRQSTVLELPLMVMDATLQFKKYMGLNPESAIVEVQALLDEVEKWDGTFSVLWHNTHFSEHKYAGWCKVYEQMLDLGNRRQAKFMTGHEILMEMGRHVI